MQHLSSTNEEPQLEDMTALRAGLDGVNQDIHAIDDQIRHLQQHIDELVTHRSSSEATRQELKSALGAYRRIPEDIWRPIFLEAVDPGFLERYFRYVEPVDTGSDIVELTLSDRTAWHISNVCSLWRDIALTQSALWTTISVNLNTETAGQRHLLLIQLGRAGHWQDLAVHIVPHFLEDYDLEYRESLLQPLFSTSLQWTFLLFDYPGIYQDSFVGLEKRLPKLRTIAFMELMGFWGDLSHSQFLRNAPLLKEFIGDGMSKPFLGDTVIAWTQPAGMRDSQQVPDGHLTETLKHLPFLKTCEVYGGCFAISEYITHTSLQSLTFIEQPPDLVAQRLFNYLTLPSLRYLHITTSPKALSGIPAFLERSGCQLTALSIEVDDSMRFDAEDLAAILAKTPFLRCLILEGMNYDHYLFQPFVLANPSGDLALVPLLEVVGVINATSVNSVLSLSGWNPCWGRENLGRLPAFDSPLGHLRPNLRIVTKKITLGLGAEYDTTLADKRFAMEFLTPD